MEIKTLLGQKKEKEKSHLNADKQVLLKCTCFKTSY